MPPAARKAAAKKAPARKRAATRPTIKQPTDRQRSARQALAGDVSGKPYWFEHDGQTFELPNARAYVLALDGGTMMDAYLDADENAEMRLSLKILANAKDDVDPKSWTALRSKRMEEFSKLVTAWVEAAGVEPGKS